MIVQGLSNGVRWQNVLFLVMQPVAASVSTSAGDKEAKVIK
jgi:hypothetical protein